MNCTNCGSALSSPTGYCGTCGQPIVVPPAATDVTTQFAAIQEPTPAPHAEPYAPPVSPASPYMPPAPAYAPQAQADPRAQADPQAQADPRAFGTPPPPFGYPPPYGNPPSYGNPPPSQLPFGAAPTSPPYGGAPMPFSAQPTQQFQAIPAQPAYQPGPGPGYPAPLPFSYGSPPKQAGSVLSIVAFVLAALALVVPLIGVAGVICGVVARQRGERLGTIAASVAAGCTLLSFVLRLVLAMVS